MTTRPDYSTPAARALAEQVISEMQPYGNRTYDSFEGDVVIEGVAVGRTDTIIVRHTAFGAAGANLGSRKAAIDEARRLLAAGEPDEHPVLAPAEPDDDDDHRAPAPAPLVALP